MERKIILAVSEDNSLLSQLKENLGKEGYEVLTANDGEAALLTMLSKDVHVLLTPTYMPKFSGMELVTFAKTNSLATAVIILGSCITEEVLQALRKGAFDFLQIPFQEYDLLRSIKKALEFRELKLENIDKENELRRKERIIEAQLQVRKLLTRIIPILLTSSTEAVRNLFIKTVCDNVDQIFSGGTSSDKLSLQEVGEKLLKIMNNLGGEFELQEVSDSKLKIKGTRCPWGREAIDNPVFCMLTRGIASRLALRASQNVAVDLEKTMGNKDDYCIIMIRGWQSRYYQSG